MTRTLGLLAALSLAAAPAAAQVQGGVLDETPEGGLEEAAALYFAPPPDEEPMPAIDLDEARNAGAVALAIALGRVEEGIAACRDLRDEMQQLIGDSYGSYSVNPGWLRTYQNCLLRRGEEADAIDTAIEARQRELIARTAAGGEAAEEDSDAALRAADLMARLSARQSTVRRALRREGRMQQAFVRYYNTGKRPDILNEEPERPQVAVPAGERPLTGPAPIRIDPPARRQDAPMPSGASAGDQDTVAIPGGRRPATGDDVVIAPDEPEGEAPLSTVPGPRDEAAAPAPALRATGAPVPLRPAKTQERPASTE